LHAIILTLRPSDPGEEFLDLVKQTLGVSYRRVIVSLQLDVFCVRQILHEVTTDLNAKGQSLASAAVERRKASAPPKGARAAIERIHAATLVCVSAGTTTRLSALRLP
jgi:hypothetical protein